MEMENFEKGLVGRCQESNNLKEQWNIYFCTVLLFSKFAYSVFVLELQETETLLRDITQVERC